MTEPSNDLLRDRLANERTLLAWLRTAIALMGFGVVVARFGVFIDALGAAGGRPDGSGDASRWMGAALLFTGTLVALLGASRSRAYARSIGVLGKHPGETTLTLTTLLVTVLGLGLTIWILLIG